MITSFKLDIIDDILNKRLRPWIKENEHSDKYYRELLGKENEVPLPNDLKYRIAFQPHILFTYRVRYYCRLIDNAVANHLQQAFNTIDSDGSRQLTRYLLKLTRESVETLVADAVTHCLTLKVKPDDLTDFIETRQEKEYLVILHYLIAALIRCWIEMQERYKSVLDSSERYDVRSFYASKVGWVEDSIAQVEPINKKENKGNQKTRNTSKKKKRQSKKPGYISTTFVYKGYEEDNYRKQRLDLIADSLTAFIDASTKKQLIKSLFKGIPLQEKDKLTWIGTQAELAYLFRQLHKYLNCTDDEYYWQTVAAHFIIETKYKKTTRKVAVSADKLKSNTQKPKADLKKKLDDIVFYFGADLTKLLGQYKKDSEEVENEQNEDLSKKDFYWNNK